MFDLDTLIASVERAPVLVGGKEYPVSVPAAADLPAWDAASTVDEMAAWVADHIDGIDAETVASWPLAAIIACANHIILGGNEDDSGNASTESPEA